MPGHLNCNTEKPLAHSHTYTPHKDGGGGGILLFLSLDFMSPIISFKVCLSIRVCLCVGVSAGRCVSRPWPSDFMHHRLCHKQTYSVLELKRWLARRSSRKLSQTWCFRGTNCEWATGHQLPYLLTSPPCSNLKQSCRDCPACQFRSRWHIEIETASRMIDGGTDQINVFNIYTIFGYNMLLQKKTNITFLWLQLLWL